MVNIPLLLRKNWWVPLHLTCTVFDTCLSSPRVSDMSSPGFGWLTFNWSCILPLICFSSKSYLFIYFSIYFKIHYWIYIHSIPKLKYGKHVGLIWGFLKNCFLTKSSWDRSLNFQFHRTVNSLLRPSVTWLPCLINETDDTWRIYQEE